MLGGVGGPDVTRASALSVSLVRASALDSDPKDSAEGPARMQMCQSISSTLTSFGEKAT